MKWDDVLPLVLVVIVSLDVPFNRRAGGFSGIVSAPRLPVVSRSFGEPDMLEQRMWCEDFLSAYRSAPVDHMAKYYDRLSVLVEAAGDGRWTEPAIGAQKIADRLASLNASSGCGWPVVACQLTRSDGLIVVLAAEDGYQRQILIVHWLVASRRAVVSNHFYLNTTFNGEHEGGESPNDGELHVESFHSRFEGWAGRQDRRSLVRFQTALCTGLTVVRDYYTALPGYPTDRRLYDHAARFSCIRPDGSGGGHVYTGPQAISKQYGRLAMDNRYVRLRTVETCWSGYSSSISGTAVTLTAGVVPKAGRASAYREFVQLFVIDVRTRKIINDVLCFEPRSHTLTTSTTFKIGVSSSSLSSSLSSSSSYATSSSYTTSTTSLTLPPPLSSSSSLSKSPSRQPPHPFSYTTFTSSNPLFSFFYPSTSPCSDSLLSNKIDDRLPNMFAGVSDENGADSRPYHSELTALRSRFTANTLGIRFAAICSPCASGAGASVGSGSQPQQNVTSSKVNPRQLFIGCVPLHVKYGQLKLLFEQFGEVTYVKVYEGYNKQTGAKMLHNYAFLFFKDEKSVEKAISASPIPLDSNWNLNVSRPHHHTTTVGASDR